MQDSFLEAKSREWKLRVLIFIVLASLFQPADSQSLNYPEIFGEDWSKAVAYEKENRAWMSSVLHEQNISYPIAIAIIFPELVRYSALRDKMEISLLKTLYINLGEEYADFSVGVFQMKPSFAESLREKLPYPNGLFENRPDNDTEYRKSIVRDLEDPKAQLNYLIAFIQICGKNFELSGKDEPSRVKFLATVYNTGIDKNSSVIDSMTEKKYFNTKLFKTRNYSYSDISLFWYRQFIAHGNTF